MSPMSSTANLCRVCIRAIFFLVVLASCLSPKAFALDTDRNLKQLYHNAWKAKDEAPTQTAGLTQTTDGYLWFASQLGLSRFNGLRFEPYTPPSGVSFPSHSLLNIYGTRDGGLWISFSPWGAAYIKNDQVRVFPQPELELYSFLQDKEGRVWANSLTMLRYFDGAEWKEFRDPNLKGKRIWSLFCDRSGGLWVATNHGIFLLPRKGESFQQVGHFSNVQQVGQSKNGEMWMADWSGHIGPLFGDSPAQKPRTLTLSIAASFLFDRDGSLWLLTNGRGLGRLRFPKERLARGSAEKAVEWFSSTDGLSNNFINSAIEDSEGDIWITTLHGVDKFRHSAFAPVEAEQPTKEFTLQAAKDGGVWVGSSTFSPITLFNGESIVFRGPKARVISVCQDSKGIIWWGVQGGLLRQDGRQFTFYPQPQQFPFDWVWEVAPDNETGGLWVGMGDSGLIRFNNGVWSNRNLPSGLPHETPSASFHENDRRTWFGYDRNLVASLSNGKVTVYTSSDGLNIGRIRCIRGTNGLLWFGGETGLQVLRDGRFKNIETTGPIRIGKVTGITLASDGALWLNESNGLLRIPPTDVERIAKNSKEPVSPRLYDSLDGLPGAGQIGIRSSTLLESVDHKIWIATDGGPAWTTTAMAQESSFAPPVSIHGVRTDTREYPTSGKVELPPGTTTVRFDYDAPGIPIPEKLRFRYFLEGVDDHWHEADAKRDVTYNNLSPGQYRFKVMASNGPGEWAPSSASLQFSILPLFYQTHWFRAVVVFVFAMLLWMIFLVRLRQSNEQIEARLGERLLERERIARELHDTLLQGFQMLVLRFQVITDTLPSESPTRKLLEDSLSRAEHTLQEGRDKVSTLRSERVSENDLAAELAQFGRELSTGTQTSFQFTVEGCPRAIHPVVYEEIQMIARETIANAFRHANATVIECVIQWRLHRFSFVCRDNGCGIPKEVLEAKTKQGHWGLKGMEERARKIGGSLHIRCGETGGTEVQLGLRGGVAYGSNTRMRFLRFRKQARQ